MDHILKIRVGTEYLVVVLSCLLHTALLYPLFEGANNYPSLVYKGLEAAPYYEDYLISGQNGGSSDLEDYAQLSELASQLADMYNKGELDANQLYEFLYPGRQGLDNSLYDVPFSDYSGTELPSNTKSKPLQMDDKFLNLLSSLSRDSGYSPQDISSSNSGKNMKKKSDLSQAGEEVNKVDKSPLVSTTDPTTTATSAPTPNPSTVKVRMFKGQKEIPFYRPPSPTRTLSKEDDEVIRELKSLALKNFPQMNVAKRFVSSEDELERQMSNLRKHKE